MSRSRHPAFADPAARVLALQRKLGNAGFAKLVQRARAGGGQSRMLQRFAGPEHEELGNTLHTSIDLGHGVTLTWGQVLAIAGDEIGTVEELLADPSSEEGRHRLGASMLNAELQGPLPAALQPTKAQIESHSSEFQRLALENVDVSALIGEHATLPSPTPPRIQDNAADRPARARRGSGARPERPVARRDAAALLTRQRSTRLGRSPSRRAVAIVLAVIVATAALAAGPAGAVRAEMRGTRRAAEWPIGSREPVFAGTP